MVQELEEGGTGTGRGDGSGNGDGTGYGKTRDLEKIQIMFDRNKSGLITLYIIANYVKMHLYKEKLY